MNSEFLSHDIKVNELVVGWWWCCCTMLSSSPSRLEPWQLWDRRATDSRRSGIHDLIFSKLLNLIKIFQITSKRHTWRLPSAAGLYIVLPKAFLRVMLHSAGVLSEQSHLVFIVRAWSYIQSVFSLILSFVFKAKSFSDEVMCGMWPWRGYALLTTIAE